MTAHEMTPEALRIYEINDCDWWLAPTQEAALADWKKTMGMNDEDLEEIRLLPDEELDIKTFTDEEYERDSMEQWRCTCGSHASLTDEWRWDGTAWSHNHGETVGFLKAVQKHRRSFRFQLSRDLSEDASTIRCFASSNI